MASVLRTGRSSDLEAILQLWVRAEAEPSHTDDVESLSRLIERDPSALIVAENGRSIVGSVIAGWDGWRGSIYRLVVAPSHRRLGLGRRLVLGAGGRLAAQGCVRRQAIVVETESKAMGFWQASGWEQQVHRSRFVHG